MTVDKERKSIAFFPGSIEEYERMVGYCVEAIDIGRVDKGTYFRKNETLKRGWWESEEDKQAYMTAGIEAIVNCQFVVNGLVIYWYGLPVKRLDNF